MSVMGRAAWLAVLLTLGAGAAHATVYDFTYTGSATNPDYYDYTATGSGSFTLDTTTGTAALVDVTLFNFTMTVTDLNQPAGSNTDVLTYSLSNPYNGGGSDLTDFAAAFGPGGALASLSLTTDYGYDTALGSYGSWYTIYQDFVISDLTDGSTFDGDVGTVTSGGIGVSQADSPVPEPASAALLAGALLSLGIARRRA